MNPKLVCGVVLAAAAMGCGASFPPPNDQWAAAQADVGRAQAGGAPTNPDAKLHLQLAVEDLQTAKKDLAMAESAELRRDETTTSQAAYMAAQTARLAQLRAAAKVEDAHVSDGQAERDRIQLAARTHELQQAQSAADLAAAKTRALQSEADALKAKQN